MYEAIFIGGVANGKEIKVNEKYYGYNFPLSPEINPINMHQDDFPINLEKESYLLACQLGQVLFYTLTGEFNIKFVEEIGTWILTDKRE